MRGLIILTLAVCATALQAVENQAFLGIFAETKVQKMVGMPEMSEEELAAMANLPGMANMPMFGRPQRLLTVRLWSPGIAPAAASASLGIPAGLKLGPKLDLALYRPEAERVETGPGEFDPDNIPDFTIKRYWGSSPTVKPGQPEIITWGNLSPEAKAAMREEAAKASRRSSYFYKPDWTTGYWPTGQLPGAVAMDAALVGAYTLITTYTGNVRMHVQEAVNFLAPLQFSSPKLDKAPPLDKPLLFEWAPVPNTLGLHAQIIGMLGKNTLIIWSSSEIRTGMETSWDYLQMAEVAELVRTTAAMAGDRKEVTAPAGIFKDCDMVYFTMIGWGPGAALAEGQPLPRLQTKTTFSCMLGGKGMQDMMGGGMPGTGDD